MTNDVLSLGYLLALSLYLQSPVLSGNMRSHIKIVNTNEREITLEIDAPFYDMNKWKQTGQIQHTRKNINGFTSYAYWVNQKSKHWVNRACFQVANAKASELNANVDNKLPL